MGKEAMRRLFVLTVLLLALPAHAVTIMINNGLAPPNPNNVIDHAAYRWDDVYVRNPGCPLGWPAALPDWPCASPGSATEVEVVDGGEVLTLNSYDSSKVTVSSGWVAYMHSYDSSTVTMNGGEADNLYAYSSSTVTMSGGEADGPARRCAG